MSPMSDTPGTISVTGTIVAYHDAVPVDGGVTLTVEAKDGTRTDFYLPSFFTPEPVEENWEIYQVLGGIQVGDTVRIEGERTEFGVSITAVEPL